MNQSNLGDPASQKEAKLPCRDWILLPLLSLLTICLVAGSTEWTARRIFSEAGGVNNCLVLNDPSTGVRGIPNSVCWEKIPEGQWTEYKFDRCGYRAGMECGPKPPGTYRIVMTGSSLAMGEGVSDEKTLAALLPAGLTRLTGRKVELYNEGMGYGFARNTALRFNDVLAARPDMVLWVLTPMDIGQGMAVYAEIAAKKTHRASWILSRVKDAYATDSILAVMGAHMSDTGTGLVLQHFLFENESQNQYIKSCLKGPERASGFLRAEPSAAWETLLADFDAHAADIEGRTKAAGVPFVAVLVPNRAQAAMISIGKWPAGYDPYKLGDEVRSIITRHGGIYVNILPDYRDIPNPEKGFYPVDGHPNAKGHAMIADMMAKELTSGAVPALKAAAQPQNALQQGR